MTCSRVIIINKGKIEALDTPENLRARISSRGEVLMEIKVTDASAAAKKLRVKPHIQDVSYHRVGDWVRFQLQVEGDPREDIPCPHRQGGMGLARTHPAQRHLGAGFCRGHPRRRNSEHAPLLHPFRSRDRPLLPPASGLRWSSFFFVLLTSANFQFTLKLLNRTDGQVSVMVAFFNSPLFWFPFLLMFPLLTMRLFSEEYKLGTIETLMTAPVRDIQVVLAKFFGAFVFYMVLWIPSLLYFFIFQWQAQLSAAETISSYFGAYTIIALVGLFYLSLGCLASALDQKPDHRRHGRLRPDLSPCSSSASFPFSSPPTARCCRR